ncbi:hypothetical protein [Agromyces sp. NPDC049794]|uniref:hypothetical protein n=1 Tax=unclassified Agromyces TaxID=2639701 RepID=UPI00340C5294
MGVPSRIPTAVAWVVAALLVASAPLLHAICIAPAESAAASHIMADGSVMTIAAAGDAAASGDAEASGHAGHVSTSAGADPAAALPVEPAAAAPSTALLDTTGAVGMIVVFAGFAVLSLVMFVRRCRMLPALSDPPRRWPSALLPHDVRDRHPLDVDLSRLGISRT